MPTKNKKLLDYQWPSAFIVKKNFVHSRIKQNNRKELKKIEFFFSSKLGCQAKLFPSARSAISIILRFLKIDRSKEVFTDRWSSHCLFNTVGALTNVSTSFSKPDLVICIHKWGVIKKINFKKNFHIIEDSVDSIILNKKNLFPNKGEFEIISLPKIIGSMTGGLVLSRNKKFLKFCEKEQTKNIALGVYQAKAKFESFKKNKNFNTWLYHESWNTYVDGNCLYDIKSNLKNFDTNKRIIFDRLKKVKKDLDIKHYFNGRIGPVLPIDITKVKNPEKFFKNFLIRHNSKNISKKIKFKKFILLPLHQGISDKKFNIYLNFLKKNLKS